MVKQSRLSGSSLSWSPAPSQACRDDGPSTLRSAARSLGFYGCAGSAIPGRYRGHRPWPGARPCCCAASGPESVLGVPDGVGVERQVHRDRFQRQWHQDLPASGIGRCACRNASWLANTTALTSTTGIAAISAAADASSLHHLQVPAACGGTALRLGDSRCWCQRIGLVVPPGSPVGVRQRLGQRRAVCFQRGHAGSQFGCQRACACGRRAGLGHARSRASSAALTAGRLSWP